MTRVFWELKDNLDPIKCLVFPKEEGITWQEGELDSSQEIDLELFDDIVKTSTPISDSSRGTIVHLIKNGYTSGEIEE